MDYLIPVLVTLTLAVLVFAAMTTRLEDRRYVLTVVAIGLAIRLTLCIVFLAFPSTRIFHEDAVGYERIGMRIAASWHGDAPPFEQPVFNYGYYFWNGILYYLLGPYQLIASCFNALIGCVTAIALYRIASRLFIVQVARRAFLFALFFPSMILWSSVAVKESIMMFLLVACMGSVLHLKKRLSFVHVARVVAALAAIFVIRFYMFYMTGLAILLSLTLFSGRGLARGLATQVLVTGAMALFLIFFGLRQEAAENLTAFDLQRVSTFRAGMASTANSGWKGDADVSTPTRAIAFVPYGLALLLFSPFPWQFNGLRPMLTLPEMLIWWPLTFSWLRGLRYVLRRRRSELMPILVFASIVALAYSITHGNVGVAFRQRSQIMIFLFLLAAVGWEIKKLRARGSPDDAIEAAAQADPMPKLALAPRAIQARAGRTT